MHPLRQQPLQSMVNAIRRTCEFRIDLVSDEVILVGHVDESAGKVLQGSLVLNLSESIKVKSIGLTFVGKMKVSWSQGVGHHQQYHKQEKTLLEKKWQFLPVAGITPKKIYNLAAGQHHWDFELTLPGNLPESLEAEGGRVSYGLKAVIERSAFVHNISKKRSIRIVRCMSPSELELIQTLEIHNTWADKIVYDITLPSKVYAYGENIPTTFDICPIASQLQVRCLTAFLKEYCTYTANDYSKTDTRLIHTERIYDPFDTDQPTGQGVADSWHRVIELSVPSSSPLIFCDVDNDMINIRHKLKFVISLANADGHLSELRCSIPIIIIDSFAQQTVLNSLPTYDEAWRSVPYDTSVWPALRSGSISSSPSNRPQITPSDTSLVDEQRQPVVISGHTRNLSIASTAVPFGTTPPHTSLAATDIPINRSGCRGHPLPQSISPGGADGMWWHGMNLSRVPSYGTAVQFGPANVSSSLPTYDSISPCSRVSRS